MKLFDKVKCKGFYSNVYDGTYIALDREEFFQGNEFLTNRFMGVK